jgi:ABC-type branched-subunit amino acid transport system ATPase component/ABC-type branched-subunit amino acid transport system permease subunit
MSRSPRARWSLFTRLPQVGWVLALAVLAALIAFPLVAPDDIYRQNILFQTFLLAVGAISWNIVSGFTGYVSLGQSAFLGLGAYTTAIIAIDKGINPFLVAPLGGLVAALVAGVVGWIVMRTRGHAFVIITIALLLLLQTIGLNMGSITGGSNGLTLPLPTWSISIQNYPFYYSMLVLMVMTHLFSIWIRRSKFGMGLIAIREDEGKASAIGIHTVRYKVTSFIASAVFLGIAGGVYAYYLTFIDPRGMFDILVSVSIVLAVLVGGKGSVWGPVVGAFIVQPLNEATNVYARGSQSRLILFGGLLVIVVLFLPNGIIPTLKRLLDRRRLTGTAVLSIEQDKIARRTPASISGGRHTPSRSDVLLEVTDLSKRFGGLQAVDTCSFSVRAGSISGLIGPNGSGKTTIFNLITGMMRPDDGRIIFDGRQIQTLRPWDRAHLGLGRTYQITRLFKDLTVLENVVAPISGFRWRQLGSDAVSGPEAHRAAEILDFVGMGGFTTERASHLSFGQQKLVELAQVLMLDPKLILLDEPAGGINPRLVERIVELIRTLNAQGTTFLIVEHNMPMVLGLCDPVIVVARGAVLAEGPSERIRRDPLVLDAYLGENRQPEPGPEARVQ